MASEGQHFTVNKGEAATLTITIAGSGSISGWSLTFKAGAKDLSGSALITRTVGAGVTITDAANRIVSVALTATNTGQTPGTYLWSLFRTDSGSETALSKGNLRIRGIANQLT